jgi:hypothetical protein
MQYIAVRAKKNQYKFINVNKVKQQLKDITGVIMIFGIVYLMMFI